MEILFATRLRNLRHERKLKQSELGEALQTSQRKISCWEVGDTEPSLSDLWRISDFFEVSIDYLIGKTDY